VSRSPDAGEARAEVEGVARASYGRLVAILAASHGEIAAAEDALADALVRALDSWPTVGVPANPTGWILTVARNRLKDQWKSAAHRTSVSLDALLDQAGEEAPHTHDDIPDKRLALLFVCSHPAIDPAARTPLMLQTVLGFRTAEIARAFAVAESAMAQRLVRAKRRIRNARIPFTVPDRTVVRERLPAVLEAVYGTFSINAASEPEALSPTTMSAEALYLAFTLADLLVDEPEAWGLAALLALSLARAPARRTPEGVIVTLADQDPALWDVDLIRRGEAALWRAHRLGRVGRFQLEAAIQSAHCDRRRTGSTDWVAVRSLSGALVRLAPTLGARTALASTIAETDGPAAALRYLDAQTDADEFQPAWATRAHLLARLGQHIEATNAFDRAITLCTDAALRDALRSDRDAREWPG
jgi:predicted RNA polymerase sigma factor